MDATHDVDQLYAIDLGEFTEARNALARRLREEGDADQASEVAALRKPSLPVWVANQLARRRRRDVDLLLHASHRMRLAAGESDPKKTREGLDKARTAEQEAIIALRAAAEELLAERGATSSATVERVVSTLRNASRSDEGRELLASGRLTDEVAPAGFGLVQELAPKRRGRPARRDERPRPDDVNAARTALRDAKERQRQAERARRKAEQGVEDARRAADAAAAAVDEAQVRLDRLRRRP